MIAGLTILVMKHTFIHLAGFLQIMQNLPNTLSLMQF